MNKAIFDKEFFDKLSSLSMNMNLKLSRGEQGGRKSKAKGVSVEFSDFREYSHGDDFRRIDWNAYGRFEKLFVKLFMEEREATFNIFIDGSQSMDFGEFNKGNVALKIAASLSYIALNNLDKVKINCLRDNNLQSFNMSTGKIAFQKILNDLTMIKFQGSTNLKTSISRASIRNNGMSVIISDFLTQGGVDEIENTIKYLAYKKQEIVLIQVLCIEERDPELYGTLNLIDCETNNGMKVSITPKILQSYKETLKEYNYKLEELIKKYGGIFIKVNSEDDIGKIILNDFYNSRLIG